MAEKTIPLSLVSSWKCSVSDLRCPLRKSRMNRSRNPLLNRYPKLAKRLRANVRLPVT